MNDEGPKDYSRLYIEERPPPVPSGRDLALKNVHNNKHKLRNPLQMDGACQPTRHRELDFRELLLKLQDLTHSVDSHANDALSQHYTSFVEAKNPKYRVMVKYPKTSNSQEDDVYAIRIHDNTLRAVKDKLPRRGNFRFFFRTSNSNCLEEVESDDSPVPVYADKDGKKQIYVQMFDRLM